jgi:acyl carrier protein
MLFEDMRTVMDARALVIKIVDHDAVPHDEATPLQSIKNWDSLSTVALVLELEEKLGRELTDDEVGRLHTLRDIQDVLGLT